MLVDSEVVALQGPADRIAVVVVDSLEADNRKAVVEDNLERDMDSHKLCLDPFP